MHGADARGGGGTVKLVSSPAPPPSSSESNAAAGGAGGGRFVCLHLGAGGEDRGVDLGAVGRALGLEPASVRLNGYLLGAGGPDHVAPSVTWRSLLSFFSARGLPTGSAGCGSSGVCPVSDDPAASGAIIVQGRPTSPSGDRKISGCCFLDDHAKPYHRDERRMIHSKRKSASHHASPPGGGRGGEREHRVWFPPEDGVNDAVLRIAKKLRLNDERPPPKRKRVGEPYPGPGPAAKAAACSKPAAGFSPNCVAGHRKRRGEEELAVPLPCKRAA